MEWPLDSSVIKLSADTSRACAFELACEPVVARQLVDAGLWWVLPIGQRREEIFGLRVIPGVPLERSPVVKVVENQVKTVVSRVAQLIPFVVFPGTVLAAKYWDAVLEQPEVVWTELRVVHRALGGDDDLAGIRALLGRAELRDALVIGKSTDALIPSLATAYRAIDPAPETRTYLEYLARAVTDGDAPLPLPEVGVWRAAAASVAFSAAALDEELADTRMPASAWELLRAPSGLDCFQGDTPMFVVEPNGSTRQMVEAAELLSSGEGHLDASWSSDPWWPAIMALGSAGDSYDGAAHLDASLALKRAGRGAEAFAALAGAACWYARRGAGPLESSGPAAIALCDELGWGETGALVRRLLELAQS